MTLYALIVYSVSCLAASHRCERSLDKSQRVLYGFLQNDGMQSELQEVTLLDTTDDPGVVRFTVEAVDPPLLLTGIANEGLSDKGLRVSTEGISVYGTISGERASFTALPCID